MATGAVILCGGRSRRMGLDKANLPFGPEALLQRVVRLAGEACGPIVVVAAAGQSLPALPKDVIVVRDAVADLGPVPGLAAGLAAIEGRSGLAYASATDAPFLRPGWIEHLVCLIGDHDVAVVRAGGYDHPLGAVYRVATVLPAIEAMAREGRSRLRDVFDLVRTRRIEAESMRATDPDLASLRNLNSLEDYRSALRDAGFAWTGLGEGSPP